MESHNIDLEGTIIYKAADKQQVYGWASIISKHGEVLADTQGDQISAEELEKMAHDFVLNCRKAGSMHQVVKGVGRLIESVVLTKEKATAMGVELPNGHEGWWVGFQIDSPEIWKRVKDGELAAFSIHGRGVREPV
jgi:hypothetical protein